MRAFIVAAVFVATLAAVVAQGGVPHHGGDGNSDVAPFVDPNGGSLSLTWEDCGSNAHVKVTDIEPKSIALGGTTTLSGAGDLDADVSGGTFDMEVTGLFGVKVLACKGDASQKKVCKLPAGLGSFSYDGVAFPIKKGHITGVPKVDVTLGSSVPKTFLKTTTTVTATATDGSQIFCAKIHSQASAYTEVANAEPLTVQFAPELLMANGTHYEDPKPNGCQSDEQSVQIQNVKGDFCSPKCTGFIIKNKCPADVPAGVTAKPQCALKTTTGAKYCALLCSPTTDEASLRAGDSACGKATCKAIQGVGLCTYDD